MKKLSLALAAGYVLFFPFSRTALRVGRFGLTPSDACAGVLILLLIAQAKSLRLAPKLRPWLLALGVFVAIMLLSAARAGGAFSALEALPYAHALILTTALAAFLSEETENRIALLRAAFQGSVLVAVLPLLVVSFFLTPAAMPPAFLNIAGSYQFFSVTTNQFSFMLLTALMATLAFAPLSVPRDLLVFMIAGFGLMSCGSRSGLVVYLVVCAVFLALPLRWRDGVELSRSRRWAVRLFFALFLGWLLMANRNHGYGGGRSVSVVDYAKRGEVADSFRKAQFARVKAEVPKNPFFGMGLGKFLRTGDGYEIHNTFLAVLTEAGVVGLLIFLALHVFLARVIWTSKRAREYRFAGLAVMAACFLYMGAQHVMRERWLWVLYLMLVAHFA